MPSISRYLSEQYWGYVAYIDLKEKQFYAELERQKKVGKP